MTQAEIENAILQIERTLNSGATSTTVDGETVNFDHESLRKRLKELKNQLRVAQGKKPVSLFRPLDQSNAFNRSETGGMP